MGLVRCCVLYSLIGRAQLVKVGTKSFLILNRDEIYDIYIICSVSVYCELNLQYSETYKSSS